MYMKAPYDSEIRSTSGHVLPAKAGDIVWVPPVVEPEARAIGWQPADAPAAAAVVEAPKPLSDNVPSDEVDEFQVELDMAVSRIIVRNDPAEFKGDGTPKMNAVVAEMSPDHKRPTATQVADAFERLQENLSLADD